MVRDAQVHEAEDKKRREAIEARNQLESMVFTVAKHLEDSRDRVPPGERNEVEAALSDARQTLESNRESTDAALFKSAFDRLQKASHKLAEVLYKSAAAEAAPSQQADAPRAGDVVDATYEEPRKHNAS